MTREATDREIRAAYRLLARRYHPDMAEGFSVERFHAIQEAWEVLRDEPARRAHARALTSAPSAGSHGHRRSTDGFHGHDQKTRGVQPLGDLELDDLHLELELRRDMAVRGGHFTTRVALDLSCPACHGHGITRTSCDMCEGRGRLELRVRTSLRLPGGIRHGEELQLDCYFELFGHRVATARVFLV